MHSSVLSNSRNIFLLRLHSKDHSFFIKRSKAHSFLTRGSRLLNTNPRNAPDTYFIFISNIYRGNFMRLWKNYNDADTVKLILLITSNFARPPASIIISSYVQFSFNQYLGARINGNVMVARCFLYVDFDFDFEQVNNLNWILYEPVVVFVAPKSRFTLLCSSCVTLRAGGAPMMKKYLIVIKSSNRKISDKVSWFLTV